jgi:hypothetical protein
MYPRKPHLCTQDECLFSCQFVAFSLKRTAKIRIGI